MRNKMMILLSNQRTKDERRIENERETSINMMMERE
jgi:hypothetical protein